MEVPLQRIINLERRNLNWCFNPCFNGSSSSTAFRDIDSWFKESVSILVLMEVPLQLCRNVRLPLLLLLVSILVLMEVPLQHPSLFRVEWLLFSFNPCFNGSSSSTLFYCAQAIVWVCRFNPCFNGSSSSTFILSILTSKKSRVSILVLMEVPLQHYINSFFQYICRCFNPCFNGSSSSTMIYWNSSSRNTSFNPCFNGSSSSTRL